MKLRELQSQEKNQFIDREITLVVLSNINLEPYFHLFLNNVFAHSFVSVKVMAINYMEFLSDSFDEIKMEVDIFAVIPNYEAFYKNWTSEKIIELYEAGISNEQKVISKIYSATKSLIVWFGYEDYFSEHNKVLGNIPYQNGLVDKLNLQISGMIQENIAYVDTKRLIANIGIVNAYNNKNRYRWNSPYSKEMIEQICNEIYKQYLIANGVTKKCIVLDCDNVLWDGIVSEDGIEYIHLGNSGLGHSYQDFQRYLLLMYNHGVILTICSKNDKLDIIRMFQEHSGMILEEKHIAIFQVNWNNKVDNIRQIADALNIGLESMVFIDDSDFEIESVKKFLPEVESLKYERDTIYKQLSCFNLKSNVDMEKVYQRNITYKTNQQRIELKDNSNSLEDYLNSLDMKIDIHPVLTTEYARVSELTQRTNKCTNGKRYNIADIKQRTISEAVSLYSVCVSDCFSTLGLVGVFEIEDETLKLFSLSCRALGREVENRMVKFILEKYEIQNIVYKSTGKNSETKKFLVAAFPNAMISYEEN